MNAPTKVSETTSKTNSTPKVFPKKETPRQRGRLAGSNQAAAPAEGARLNLRKGQASTTSRPSSHEEPIKSNAVNPEGFPPIGGTVAIRFECVAPRAKAVFVAGSFNGWNPAASALTRRLEGRWTADLALPSGRHEYLFVVDGAWTCDETASEYVPNPFGGRNSVVTVS